MAPYSGTPRYFEDFKVETWLGYGLDEVQPPGIPCGDDDRDENRDENNDENNDENDNASAKALIVQQTTSPKGRDIYTR
jgi:hypothetical protein